MLRLSLLHYFYSSIMRGAGEYLRNFVQFMSEFLFIRCSVAFSAEFYWLLLRTASKLIHMLLISLSSQHVYCTDNVDARNWTENIRATPDAAFRIFQTEFKMSLHWHFSISKKRTFYCNFTWIQMFLRGLV